MLLSDRDIVRVLKAGGLTITPEPGVDAIQPSSVELRLGSEFRPLTGTVPIDTRNPVGVAGPAITMADGEPFRLPPGGFVLASTLEAVALGDWLAARLEGRSSLGRLGLLVHATAGFIDPGFSGHITFELSNLTMAPLLLWPGDRVAQLALFQLSSRVLRSYADVGRYQDQQGPTPSRGVS